LASHAFWDQAGLYSFNFRRQVERKTISPRSTRIVGQHGDGKVLPEPDDETREQRQHANHDEARRDINQFARCLRGETDRETTYLSARNDVTTARP